MHGSTTIPAYVYTTYIRATPEQVWNALTDPELTGHFWGHAQVSDWVVAAGSTTCASTVPESQMPRGTVVEVDRPRRLVFGFDDPKEADDPTVEPSLVSFEIEAYHDIVRLTLTHSNLRTPGDLAAIGQGWPSVLANLKTLLETGDVLPQAPWEFHTPTN
jgi:uncharacterized protein YndB with AHSA1/START domain